MTLEIPAEEVLRHGGPPADAGRVIGRSREGRELIGYGFGTGASHVSLIGGCHADEPVGPAMLDRLAAFLHALDPEDPLLTRLSWWLVPHANPDGEARNAPWTRQTTDDGDAYDVASYMNGTVRELPGDDVEFGFPRSADDVDARPENRAMAAFLAPGAPFLLHGSFHGMAFAAGPWFLVESTWVDRTADMRRQLRRRVRDMGYVLHDVDRQGEKGFHRIDEGFTTRPDSRAMVAHFEALGDAEMASRFRPSSMEYVRSLGGDPLTLVSEMPLFLLPAEHYLEGNVVRPPVLDRLFGVTGAERLRGRAEKIGVRAMPIRHQMHLQLAFLEEGLRAALAAA